MTTFLHYMAGPTIVKFDAVELGYAEDRVQIRVEPKWDDIHSDDFGGQAGAPSDAQLLGGIAIVTATLTKYVKADLEKLTAFRKTSTGTAGVLPTIGSFVRQDNLYGALILDGTVETKTFDIAFLRQAVEMNSGTRHRKYMIGFECWITDTCYRELFVNAAGDDPCDGSTAAP